MALQTEALASLDKSTRLTNIKDKISRIYFNWKSDRQYFLGSHGVTTPLKGKFGGLKFRSKKIVYIVGIAILTTFLFLGLVKLISSFSTKSSTNTQVAAARATRQIDKEYEFPLRNDNGDVVSKIKFRLELAELRDEIIVKGQKAQAIKGREFVIINLKITNEHNQPIEINTRDYVRLSVNGNEQEWLAPDIHNDPVEVQAISTKYTRIGFPVSTSDKNLVLQIGEINGSKEKIKLDF